MSNPTESPLSPAAADALSGTADAQTGAIYNTIGAVTYYTAAYQKEAIWNRAMALSNSLRVVKDGTLTFGVMPGTFRDARASILYPGCSGMSLANNATNYVFLDPDGSIHANTTGFSTGENVIPLATIVTAGGTYSHADISDMRGMACFTASGASGVIEASTAGAGSPNFLTGRENGKILTNEGASARAYNTLPSAAAGLAFDFIVSDADGMRITAVTGDTIRVGEGVSSSGGYIQNATIGSAIRLVAVNATEWIAVSTVGTWTVDS
ncbi:MAG: hypothetical protein NTV86_13075 [Planctomycetota bacterium]|nr:hypothetical protein [Planctomycetota bacterium]